MKKIYLSLLLTTILYAKWGAREYRCYRGGNSPDCGRCDGEEIQSADLADSLQQNIADISIIRRSGVANDIILKRAD